MDRFNDLEIPESLDDALHPSTLALVVYDMQAGILSQIADGDRVLANVLRVLAAAREQRVRTVCFSVTTRCRLNSQASFNCVRPRFGSARRTHQRRAR
jgi:nicotinamidase-related amidase